MRDIVVVTAAKHLKGYTLALTFSDGVRAEIDFSTWIERYPYLSALKEPGYFKSFSLDGWTVVWPNGADVAPETLHKIAVAAPSE